MSTEPAKPMLGDLTLSLIQAIHTTEANSLAKHDLPGLDGALFQNMGRHPALITVVGMAAGDTAKDDVEHLRQLFHAAEPLSFVADIMTATEVQQVLIADLVVRDVAGKPDNFWYRLLLTEYITPPEEEDVEHVDQAARDEAAADQEETESQVDNNLGVLEVTVETTDPNADLSKVQIQVEGTTSDGEDYSTVLAEPANGVFRKEDVPPGEYTLTMITS